MIDVKKIGERREPITDNLAKLDWDAVVGILEYFRLLSREMDDKKGKGWSEKHPEVIASLSLGAAINYYGAVNALKVQELDKTISLK